MPPEPLTRGLPHPRSPFCPLSSTEFVEPPRKKIPGYATALRNLFCVKLVRSARCGKSFELAYDRLYCTTWCLAPARAGETFSGRIPKLWILQGEILWRLET